MTDRYKAIYTDVVGQYRCDLYIELPIGDEPLYTHTMTAMLGSDLNKVRAYVNKWALANNAEII